MTPLVWDLQCSAAPLATFPGPAVRLADPHAPSPPLFPRFVSIARWTGK